MNAIRNPSSLERRFVAVFAAAMLIGSYPAHAHNDAVGIAFPVRGITVDGDLGDWPAGLRMYPIERIESGDKLRGKDDLEAHFRLAFNSAEKALYVAVEVRDDSVVLDGPGEALWNTRDGCEIFVNAVHAGGGSPIIQYARHGNQTKAYGPGEGLEKRVKVAVARTGGRIVYEWRVEVDVELDPDRAIGFDVSVSDKDEDGSFSWAAWGSGTQKLDMPDRVGEFFLVGPATRFGEVSGLVVWKDPSQASVPSRVRIQSTRTAPLWLEAPVDSSGPTGPRPSPRVPTPSAPWIRRNFALTRRRASKSGSRPTGSQRPTSSASPPYHGPG